MKRTTDLVIRAPNHLGDLVMAIPALESAPDADVLVVRSLAPLVEMLPGFGDAVPLRRRVLPMDRGARAFPAAARSVRSGGYRRGVLLTPSFSSALLLAFAGIPHRRGTATDRRAALLTDRVRTATMVGLHRSAGYRYLVTGVKPADPPVPRLPIPEWARDRWLSMVDSADAPLIGVFPGGNAASRRWDADRFAEVVARLDAEGARVLVFGGPGERELTSRVAAGRALDLGGQTDLPTLAAALAECTLLVTNDSGPMHLAAAVGTPTVSLLGAADPVETGPLGAGHAVLRRPELPCVPCVKNRCPRRGPGYILPEAERECLRLIEVDEVLAAVQVGGIAR